jgi:hypothetical protein
MNEATRQHKLLTEQQKLLDEIRRMRRKNILNYSRANCRQVEPEDILYLPCQYMKNVIDNLELEELEQEVNLHSLQVDYKIFLTRLANEIVVHDALTPLLGDQMWNLFQRISRDITMNNNQDDTI